MLTCPVCGKRSCACGPGSPITFTYHDGTGPGKQGWRSAVRELDPSDSPVVPMASYTLLQQSLWDTNEALAACQSQAAGRIRVLEKEIEDLRREKRYMDWMQGDLRHAVNLITDEITYDLSVYPRPLRHLLDLDMAKNPPVGRFPNVFCSQCGNNFGPGDHGYSHCEDHDNRHMEV